MAEAGDDLVFVFDIGGVVVRLDVEARLRGLGRAAQEQDAFAQENRDLRLGRMSEADYLERFTERFAIERPAILAAERALLSGTYDDMIDAIARLRRTNRVVCFSNTNAIHWAILNEDIAIETLFDESFVSHRLGEEKPDRASYDLVAKALGAPLDRLVFVDDTLANVEAARAAGWGLPIHHRGTAETLEAIARIRAGA